MQDVQPVATINSRASIDVRALVLPRAKWESEFSSDGRMALKPQKGTWYGHTIRGRARWDVATIPMIGCPNCGGLSFLTPTDNVAMALSRMIGKKVPVAHKIDHIGRVSPDYLCSHNKCDFHRKLILDRWLKTKPLYAIAWIDGTHGKIEIDYCHAIDKQEALFHFGRRNNARIIDVGPAVGFYVDEKTGRITAD